jgi:heme-degrading monooxygenase HmoA
MIHIVWEFVVKDGAAEAFAEGYGPGGDWAQLFARHAGYRGTSLWRDEAQPRRFMTVDRWDTLDHFHRMKTESAADYARLDSRFADLTESERELGVFSD